VPAGFAVAFGRDDFAVAFARVDLAVVVFAPDDFAAAADCELREGFALGDFAAVFAVADFGPAGAPGFAAPTVEGEPEVRRAVPGVAFAAGVPGVFGADGFRRCSTTRLASSVPRVTASRPSPTAVSMMLFGFIAIRTVLPGPRGGYTARTGAGITAASPQAMASASDAGMFVRNVPSVSRNSPQARPRAGSEENPNSSMPPRGA
jgi:hypothetical protein